MFLFTRERKPRSVAVFCLLWPFRPYFVAFIAFHFLFFISRPDIDGIGRNGKGENEKENFKKISEEKKNLRNVRVDVGKHPPEVTTFFLVFFVCFFTKHEAITFGTERAPPWPQSLLTFRVEKLVLCCLLGLDRPLDFCFERRLLSGALQFDSMAKCFAVFCFVWFGFVLHSGKFPFGTNRVACFDGRRLITI